MSLSVNYASRRSEIWQWYWRAWRQRLWRTHLLVFLAVAVTASFAIYDGPPGGISEFCAVSAIGVVPLIGFALFPMLTFKPQQRTLVVDEQGLSTSIGKLNATVPWADIADAGEDGDNLVIQRRNLNAFIVPARAFATGEARTQFRDFVLAMVRENGC